MDWFLFGNIEVFKQTGKTRVQLTVQRKFSL